MGGILLVCGGDDFAQHVFRSEGRAYWAKGFPAVLEKHGLLQTVVRAEDALRDPSIWTAYDVVLIGRLPDELWTDDVLAAARAGRASAFVEGPLAPGLMELLGVTSAPLDSADGILTTVDAETHRIACTYGYSPGARIQGSRGAPLSRRSDLDWHNIDGVPITEAQAHAWRADGWDATRLSVVGDTAVPLAHWLVDEVDRFPAIVRNGRFVGASFSCFSYLAQRHTSEPFDGPEHRTSARATGVETLVLAVIDQLHAQAGAVRARVLPWPAGRTWARNVRHDFDRAIPPRVVDRLLDRHAAEGSCATWYWRARHAPTDVLEAVVAAPGHEVALHTELLWTGADDERAALEVATGGSMLGTSAHGDPDCFRYQGAPNLIWAEQRGIAYTELLQHASYLPHRAVMLDADGTVRIADLICLPHHESLDRSTTAGDTYAEQLLTSVPHWIGSGGLLQVMNHPDQNQDELFTLLGEMPREGRLDVTAADAADWWARTHSLDAMSIASSPAGGLQLRAKVEARDVVVELRAPDGSMTLRVLSTDGDGPSPIDAAPELVQHLEAAAVETRSSPREPPRARPSPSPSSAPGWDAVSGAFGDQIEDYMQERGRALTDASVQATVRTNTALVPKRGEDVVQLARELGDVPSLRGLRVLEVGTGWGALAGYLSLAHGPARLVGIDVRDDFVARARSATRGLVGADALHFAVADMVTLDGVEDGVFDLLIANNSFLYVPSRRLQREALRSFRRVLAPGGVVVFWQANPWQLREPFTRAPVVHLVPKRVAAVLARVLGWRGNHGRVRYLSAPALRRALRRAGFAQARSGVITSGGVRPTRTAKGSRFFGTAARRPPAS